MSKNITTGIAGNQNIVSGAPLTTQLATEASPTLIGASIDRAVTRVRPMATPLDQISRLGHVRNADALEVDYYSADIRADSTTTVAWGTFSDTDDGMQTSTVKVNDSSLFEPSECVMIECADGNNESAYVSDKDDTSLTLIGPMSGDTANYTGKIVRMGRAATQLDVQTPQYSVLPRKRTNFCQIFKMQIEQSIVMKLSHKEIGWDFTDQQEAAVYDMRLGMEKQFLFGHRMKVYDPRKQETVTVTEGIWHQAGKEVELQLDSLKAADMVDVMRTAFTGNSGSRRKVLIAGSGLIAALNKMESTKMLSALDQETVWGIDFNVIQSKFGRLYVVFSEVFDAMGRPDDGIIVDPEYIQKHVFIPFRADRLDLRGSGQRNTEAMVLTEASCLTLRYPNAHTRILGQRSASLPKG